MVKLKHEHFVFQSYEGVGQVHKTKVNIRKMVRDQCQQGQVQRSMSL